MVVHAKIFRFMNKYFMVHLFENTTAGNIENFRKDELISHLFFANFQA